MEKIIIIAHRSGPDLLPEQTVASAVSALECGADMVEIDTRFTSDGKIVISHDATTGRVFKEDKTISTITADEFTSLERKEAGYHGYLLSDYIKANVAPLLIHVKEGKDGIKSIVDELRRCGAYNTTTLGIHSIEDLQIARQYAPNIRILAFMRSLDDLDNYLSTNVDVIRLWEGWLTDDKLDKIHKAGKKVWVMTGFCDGRDVGEVTRESIQHVCSMNIDGVLVNKVKMAELTSK